MAWMLQAGGMMPSFSDLPLFGNLALFLGAAAVVWITGARLSGIADSIATRTAMTQAVVGLLLLAGATSLPELATTVTASVTGSSTLAASNLLGGVVTQTAVLALADVSITNRSLLYLAAQPILLLEGLLLLLMLGVVVVGSVFARSWELFSVGIWTLLVFLIFIGGVYMSHHYRGADHWRVVQTDTPDDEPQSDDDERYEHWSRGKLFGGFALGAVVILASGIVLSLTAEALAHQTNLGEAFVGALMLSLATSLPEVSTTIGAVRVGAYAMAVSNIFGSNMADVSLLFVADIAYSGALLESASRSVPIAAAMGMLVTIVYLIGLVLRESRVILGMSVTALASIAVYALTMMMLYAIR
jgi:cation:H+ antiporter